MAWPFRFKIASYGPDCMSEMLAKVGKARCLTKLDLTKGFYPVVVSDESRAKTAFISPFGKFEYCNMPFWPM